MASKPVLAAIPKHLTNVTIIIEREPTDEQIRAVENALLAELSIARRLPGTRLTVPSLTVRGAPASWTGGPEPWPKLLRTLGIGFDAESLARAESFRGFLQVSLLLSSDPGFRKLRAFQRIVGEQAQQLNGCIRDSLTREIDTPAAWNARRVSSWHDSIPDMSRQISVMPEGNGLVTSGMFQFGMKDISVTPAADKRGTALTHLLTIIAQHMVEGRIPSQAGSAELAVAAIKHPVVKEQLHNPQAKGVATIVLQEASRNRNEFQLGALAVQPSTKQGSAGDRQLALLEALLGPPPKDF